MADAPAVQNVVIEPIENAKKELEIQINDSLDGILYLNHTLDQVLAIASLPIEERVDYEYEDDDAVAYLILSTPKDTTAHFLVGLQPFQRDGKEYRYFQIEIQTQPPNATEFHRDSMREGPRIHLSIDFDSEGTPGRLSLLTERRVALHESRHSGIDAYVGRYTSGASYSVDMNMSQNATSGTYGIVNGTYTTVSDFQGITPLRGDMEVDPARVDHLLSLFMSNFDKIRRNNK